jgi:lysozyme
MIIDVSKFQGVIDWAKASKHIEGAFIKATGEETDGPIPFRDSRYLDNWHSARANGVRRGAYHFMDGGRGSGTGYDEAQFFIQTVKPEGWGEFRPVIDVEWPTDALNFDIVQLCECVDEVWESCGRAPIIYTGRWHWQKIAGSDFKWLAECPLWLASYTATCPAPPKPFESVTLWQYTSKGSVPGINGPVDCNKVVGNMKDLLL